jgi:hypothetical protein
VSVADRGDVPGFAAIEANNVQLPVPLVAESVTHDALDDAVHAQLEPVVR